MAAAVKEMDVPVCIMHNRKEIDYQNFMEDFLADMKESITIAKNAGIAEDKIMIDPGIGFAKTLSMNLSLVNHLEILKQFGYPVLLGTSRKSMIGNTLKVPVDQRLEGTIATSVIGVMKGCHFVRVHDVLENQRAIRMTEAILSAE
jgi:dihydropteroate synthase